MVEAAYAFDTEGRVLFWHLPEDASAGGIPDSSDLWQNLWAARGILGGVVHTHPGKGYPAPSSTDLTTFEAIEKGLGKRLLWPICSEDQLLYYWYLYGGYRRNFAPSCHLNHFDIEQLRNYSNRR